MAVTGWGRSVELTAVGDSYAIPGGVRELVGLSFRGTGLTADQRLRVTDTKSSVLADYGIEGVADNVDLWAGRVPQIVDGIAIPAGTIGGTWVLTAQFKD